MVETKIAVLMTCHNRKESTLACLDSLKGQENIDNIRLSVYLVDDGCTDGTGDAVKNRFPGTIVLQGTGDLYWGGGMRLAFGEALKKDYDFYLWLNDDSLLYPHAVRTLYTTSCRLKNETGKECIVTGAMHDAATGALTYGGSRKIRSWSPLSYRLVPPSDQPKPCEVINGNCVLVPREIAALVGNLSADFTHCGGDYDYSLRAGEHGFSSWVAPGYAGTCSRNSLKGSLKDNSLPFQKRVDRLTRPNAMIPAAEWMLFIKRHGGRLWPIYWLRTFIRKQFPWLWVLLRSRKVYESR
ncbi:MAG: glycosyltransferase family 2 protein [Proteobacteria bacterium]|nr:glycosyltransferase family 2 protein [Pseudomonadota bacterium]MBU1739418.1 glycosyltransferase family 2 protein [Pseudomonadota bacterium]